MGKRYTCYQLVTATWVFEWHWPIVNVKPERHADFDIEYLGNGDRKYNGCHR